MSSSHASPVAPALIRGFSRYRLSVTLAQAGPRPYGWEIRDDETDRRVRRSAEHYRTPRAAWEAGSRVLHELGARQQPSPS
ncbi:MAG: hypothetical protein JOZ42_00480 [Acetobacteraceae bacterium]|nr:hypothetical protein [Acetobacteraceae bacterium]